VPENVTSHYIVFEVNQCFRQFENFLTWKTRFIAPHIQLQVSEGILSRYQMQPLTVLTFTVRLSAAVPSGVMRGGKGRHLPLGAALWGR